MREVSQKWLNNQNKTLRDQGLLRLDFLSAHNNNAYAHIIPMGSDNNKSNINEIKEIYPYGAPTKNLAMPNLMGKPEISAGVYRISDLYGVTIDYNINTGEFTMNGTLNSQMGIGVTVDFVINGTYTYSYRYVSGTKNNLFSTQFYSSPNDLFNLTIGSNEAYNSTQTVTNRTGFINIYFGTVGLSFNNFTFKLQLEQGSTATDYVVPQPNTGYVSNGVSDADGNYDNNLVPIEVNIENYRSPLNGLTITWSENFGHAVDYSIEYNGEIYTYLNNTKKTVFVPIIVENTPDANFKIRVNKWSQGGVPIRIERIFVGLHIINYQDRIFSYTKKRVNDVLSLELPQDEINFELSNIDRMFDPLWYNSYFKYLNEKTEIRVYSGFRLDGKNAEWIKNGTFYLTDWKAPNNSITASFTAKDILGLLDADEMYSKSGALTLDDYCDIILGRDYKGVDNFEDYNLPVNPDGSKKWNIRKNLAVPDLTGKPEISEGVYRLYDANGITIDYDYWTSEFTINGTATSLVSYFLSNKSYLSIFPIHSESILHLTYMGGYSSDNPSSFVAVISNNWDDNNVIRLANSNSLRQHIFTTTQERYLRIYINSGDVYNNYKFKLQLEKSVEATDYELPIENAIVPVSMETRTKREVLQLLAQSVNAHIHLDDDANISFIRDVTGQQLDANKKIMTTKPEFNIAAPVKKIIVPISTYASDPNELELARIQVTAGETIEINHDLPYSGGRVEVSGSLTVASQDNTWFRSYKIVVGGSGSGELVLFRHQMARTTINILQDVGSSGTSMTYENPMIDTKLKASRALTKIWSEISNSRQVEFDLRIDPLFNTLDAVSFPFKVLNLEQSEFMRIDELEINYNGAYKGKIKGVILSNYGGDLTDKTYIKHTKEFNSGEENLKWHLSNK